MLGLGRKNLVKVAVDKNCRMDMNTLRNHLQVKKKGCAFLYDFLINDFQEKSFPKVTQIPDNINFGMD